MQAPRRLLASVADAIGETPLVELSRVARGLDGRIFAKLDNLNPGGSKKDRVAREILLAAAARGDLPEGRPVIELTSGNTGIGAAIMCAILGRRFIAVMSAGNSPERARMMRAFGAEVELVAQAGEALPGQVSGEDLDRVEARAQVLTDALGAFRVDQFVRAESALAHERHTGPEIWDASGGAVTAFCDIVGSGGTFAGVMAALRARNGAVRGYVVEPEGAAVLAGEAAHTPRHALQGAGYARADLPLLKGVRIDGYLAVRDAEAKDAARRLAREEGVFAGYTAGANLAAAMRLLQGPERGGAIAIMICDTGLKYLSGDLWP